MTKSGLIVVFNHKFEANIPKLEKYYADRFSRIHYLMPFSTSNHTRVVRIIENGAMFSGHIAQGIHSYFEPDLTHYVFLGDDLILNPKLNESNLTDEINLRAGSGYLKNLVPADSIRHRWQWSITATKNLRNPRFAYEAEIPSSEDAQRKFESMGLKFKTPWPRSVKDFTWMTKTFPHRNPREWLSILRSIGRPSTYPLLCGYSDFVIVPSTAVELFAHTCGVFAAMNMFAEVAVPTALALACSSIQTELASDCHFIDRNAARADGAKMRGVELWDKDIKKFGESLNYSWSRLLASYPTDVLYYHPIKLSIWK